MDIPICKVNVIVNPSLNTKYVIENNIDTGNIKINIQIQSELTLISVAKIIHSNLCIKKKYRITFNFKSAPTSVRNNSEFRHIIQKIFQVSASVVMNSDSLDVIGMAEIVQSHMNTYGHYPDMSQRTSKRIASIHNYIKSVLNSQIDIDTAIKIADIISEL